ncbi:MAG: DUF1565 domain-containing protein [Candidatus Omnitrophica bacterium]|nr:DUF1565 domain-containing protein [Candidatus Omnitrophota bacterium]
MIDIPHKRLLPIVIGLLVSTTANGATLTVGEDENSDYPTLTAAIANSSTDDTILVAPGVYDVTRGETFPILIEHSLSLIGSSSDETILDATGLGVGVVRAIDPEILRVENLTLQGGIAEDGGGLYAQRSLVTLRHCTFTKNRAYDEGGGVCLAGCYSVFIDGCRFIENLASGESDTSFLGTGGGLNVSVETDSQVAVYGSVFQGNSAEGGASGIYVESYRTDLTVDRCDFLENTTGSKGIGPALMASVIESPYAKDVVIRDSRFLGNRELRSEIVGEIGPYVVKIRNLDSATTFVQGVEVIENEGYGGLRLGGATISDTRVEANTGVGIIMRPGSINDSIISDNLHFGLNAGDCHIEGTRIERNGFGTTQFQSHKTGGMLLTGESIEILDSYIVGNRGQDGAPGGLDCDSNTLIMRNCVVMGNFADGRFDSTGAIDFNGEHLQIDSCTFNGNQAVQNSAVDPVPNAVRISTLATAQVTNSIVWDGTVSVRANPQTAIFRHCAMEQRIPGEGNLFEDPQFLHPWDGESADLRLPCDSPCVDAGTIDGAPSRDIEGVTRPRGSGVDMGAYENCRYDVNGDRSEDVKDLLSFPPEWYRPVDETNFGYNLIQLGPSEDRIDAADLDELLQNISRPQKFHSQ